MLNIAIKLYNSSLLCHGLDFSGLLGSYLTHKLDFYMDKYICFAQQCSIAVCTLLHKQPKRIFVFCSFTAGMHEVSTVSIHFS